MVSNGTHAILDASAGSGLEGLIENEDVPREGSLARAINYDFGSEDGHTDQEGRSLIGRTIGSGKITLRQDGCLILGPGTVYRFSNNPRVVRSPLHREFHQTERPTNPFTFAAQALLARVKREILGEEPVLNVYQAEEDGAYLEMSTDTVGEGLYLLRIGEGRALIARKGVWFGMERDVRMDIEAPIFSECASAHTLGDIGRALLRAAYGPGPILQRFSAKGDQNGIMFNFGGSWNEETLRSGQLSDHYDPRHVYAWDDTVKLRVVPYGSRSDLFTQPNEIRHHVEFEGPGRFWHSNGAYSNGYIGNWFRPASWVNTLIRVPGRVINALHNPIKPF